jgi:hypothetical protein
MSSYRERMFSKNLAPAYPCIRLNWIEVDIAAMIVRFQPLIVVIKYKTPEF